MAITTRTRLALLLTLGLAVTGCAAQGSIDADTYHDMAGEVLSTSSDEELDDVADELCAVLKDGTEETSWPLAVDYATEAGLTGEEAGKLLVYAASYRCADMLSRFPE